MNPGYVCPARNFGHHCLMRSHPGLLHNPPGETSSDHTFYRQRFAQPDLPTGVMDGQPGAYPGPGRAVVHFTPAANTQTLRLWAPLMRGGPTKIVP